MKSPEERAEIAKEQGYVPETVRVYAAGGGPVRLSSRADISIALDPKQT